MLSHAQTPVSARLRKGSDRTSGASKKTGTDTKNAAPPNIERAVEIRNAGETGVSRAKGLDTER